MSRMIFVNLPVTDLPRARGFYEGLGFTINEKFSNDKAACAVVSETICIMVLTRGFFGGFCALPVGDPSKATSALVGLSCEDRVAVDAMAEAALAHGGSAVRPAEDLGFMYQRSFADPHGNVFEPFWMDPAVATG
ncbi:MAG: VOC family protein [Rhodobacteraceae bacterium]|nr:VOC family protein [Paracoccaceae bacterium]